MRQPAKAAAFAALLVGTVSISWSAIFVRWSAMPGIASAFYRMLIASGALWLGLLLRRGWRMSIPQRTLVLAGLGGVFFAADVGCYNVAVLHTSAGAATFLGNNAPLVVGLVTWALTRRLPAPRFWIALAMALAGAILIVSVDVQQMRSAISADLLAFAASIFFALYLVATERLRTASSRGAETDTFTLVALSGTASAVALLLFALVTHVSLAVTGPSSLLAVTGLALVCQLGGYLTLTYALGHLPATVSSVVLLAVAPISAVLAMLFFGERMTPVQLAGGALILLAVWTITRGASVPASNLEVEDTTPGVQFSAGSVCAIDKTR